MISPAVRTRDVDPDAMAWLNRVLAGRDRRIRRTLTVVHAAGRVTAVTGDGDPAVATGDPVDDPAALAAALREAGAYDEVVVVDAPALEELSADLVDLGRRCTSQAELLWRARELWNTHPAVAQSPAPRPSRWPALADRLAAVPDGTWIRVGVSLDDGRVHVLAVLVEGGVVTELTSNVPAGAGDVVDIALTEPSVHELVATGEPGDLLDRLPGSDRG